MKDMQAMGPPPALILPPPPSFWSCIRPLSSAVSVFCSVQFSPSFWCLSYSLSASYTAVFVLLGTKTNG